MKDKSRVSIPGRTGHMRLDGAQLAAVADLFSVLSEPSRLRILQVLQNGPASVSELVERSGSKQANVSKQLGILLSAGVIDRRQDGNRAIYWIKLPLVFSLCNLVCRGVARQAAQRGGVCGDNVPRASFRDISRQCPLALIAHRVNFEWQSAEARRCS